MTPPAINAPDFSRRILAWYDRYGRHELPWQVEVNPYRVWVSEIMLQQTQVETVIPYYQRFMASFPDLQALASATQAQVLTHWAGLGYYARGRNLHRAAQQVCEQDEGRLPDTLDGLLALPGIGRSTAGAILALSMGQRYPILDGNVKRVLSRLIALDEWPGGTAAQKRLWALADELTPEKRVAAYTQAMMDMGATLCTRARPACERCPLRDLCAANAQDAVANYPRPKPKKERPVRQCRMLLVLCGDRLLLQRRPPSGIWGGLWSLPETRVEISPLNWVQEHLGQPAEWAEYELAVFRHSFSHYHLDIEPVVVHIDQIPTQVNESGGELWYNLRTAPRTALPAPVSRLIRAVQQHRGHT